MGYEEQILSWLIDSHEKKVPGNSNTRKASISITAKYAEYKEPLSDTHNDIETAIQHLLSWGYVQCSRNQQGYYTKVVLSESALPKFYQLLNRIPNRKEDTDFSSSPQTKCAVLGCFSIFPQLRCYGSKERGAASHDSFKSF